MRITRRVIYGDARESLTLLPPGLAQTCVTSPPYWGLRDHADERQIGQEATVDQYVGAIVGTFAELRRVLRDDGTLWLNLGDLYTSGNRKMNSDRRNPAGRHAEMASRPKMPAGLKRKELIGVPWRVAFALQSDGWWLRSEVVWNKLNAKPESVGDRPTKSHESLFLFAKSRRYFYDDSASPRTRSVWSVTVSRSRSGHGSVFPEDLARIAIGLTSREGDLVIDPFAGTGTTLAVAKSMGRRYLGVELRGEMRESIEKRLR